METSDDSIVAPGVTGTSSRTNKWKREERNQYRTATRDIRLAQKLSENRQQGLGGSKSVENQYRRHHLKHLDKKQGSFVGSEKYTAGSESERIRLLGRCLSGLGRTLYADLESKSASC